MIRTMFACTQTGEALPTRMTTRTWPSREETSLVSMHCPRCGKLHSFGRSEAILVVEAGGRVGAAKN